MSKEVVVQLPAYSSFSSGVNKISNSEWEVILNQPLIINQGDTIGVKQSYIDTRTTSSGSIVLTEDINVELEYYFYQMLPPDMASGGMNTQSGTGNQNSLADCTYTMFASYYDNPSWYPFGEGAFGNPTLCYNQSGNTTFTAPDNVVTAGYVNTPQSIAAEVPLIFTSSVAGTPFANSTPITKTWAYTIPAGNYTNDGLALLLTKSMAQMPTPLSNANIFTGSNGNSFLHSDVNFYQTGDAIVPNNSPAFQLTGVFVDFLKDVSVPSAYLPIVTPAHLENITFTNPFTLANGLASWTYYNSSDSSYFTSTFTQTTVGTDAISLVFDDGGGKFQFEYTHQPLQNVAEDITPTPGVTPPANNGPPIETVHLVATVNLIDNTNPDPTTGIIGAGTVNMARYTRKSGVIFKRMQPESFWSGVLGFDVPNLVVTDSQITNREITFEKFKSITTQGYLGSSDNFQYLSSAYNPTSAAPVYPYFPPTSAKAPLSTGAASDISLYQLINLANKTGQAQSFYDFPFESVATIPINATRPPVGSNRTGHSLVEIHGYTSEFLNDNQSFQVKAIVSDYYQSQSAFTTGPFMDSYLYTHIGESIVLSCLKCRLLDPFTMNNLLGVGPNSCIYLQITKNYSKFSEGQEDP